MLMEINFFLFIFVPKIILSCDEREILASKKAKDIYKSYFIFGVDGISNGSFELKELFRAFQFSDPNHGVPFIAAPGDQILGASAHETYCKETSNQIFLQRLWMISSNATIKGVLYGCAASSQVTDKIFVLNARNWTKNEIRKLCLNFPGIPEEFSKQQETCWQDFRLYKISCLKWDEKVNSPDFRSFILAMLAVILTISIFYKIFKILAKQEN